MLEPVGERIILQKTKQQEKTASGIYLPPAKDEKQEGIVVAVGSKDGKPLPLQKGDRIIYGGYSSTDVEHNGEEYVIVEYKDIVAVVK